MAVRTISAAIAIAGLLCVAAPAFAQVKDGPYRGTLVCSKLPFLKGLLRSAIEVTIAGNAAQYKRSVLNPEHGTVLGTETGSGSVDGQAIKLSGSWHGDKLGFDASYSGTFVRRGAKLSGTQVWTHEGKTYNRTCTGAIKRPLAIFMRRGAPS